MKKTYIVPKLFAVTLNTKTSILQASPLPVSEEELTTPDDILTKENKGGRSLWDTEW